MHRGPSLLLPPTRTHTQGCSLVARKGCTVFKCACAPLLLLYHPMSTQYLTPKFLELGLGLRPLHSGEAIRPDARSMSFCMCTAATCDPLHHSQHAVRSAWHPTDCFKCKEGGGWSRSKHEQAGWVVLQ